MRLPPEFIDEIKHRVPCSHVIGQVVKLKRAGREWRGLSPFNAEKTPSFYVNDSKQAWFDFSAGKNGNVFDFLMEHRGLTFPEAVESLAREAGLDMPAGWRDHDYTPDPQYEARRAQERADYERRKARQEAHEARRKRGAREHAHDLWKLSHPLKDTLGDRYFRLRGVEFAARFGSLRFLERCEHIAEGGRRTTWPAVVARVTAPDGAFCGIWRIYLDPALDPRREGKAPVDKAKLGLGSYTEHGGSVWLGKPTPDGNVCEGIETGCGVWGIRNELEGRPEAVQCALSTSGLTNFLPPAGVQRTVIWPDGDTDRFRYDMDRDSDRHTASPGMTAAEKARFHLIGEGHEASIRPTLKTGRDYLTQYVRAKRLLDEI